MSVFLYGAAMAVYYVLMTISTPLAYVCFRYVYRSLPRQKQWVHNRMGQGTKPASFTGKPVVWIHGADIGELKSGFALAQRLCHTSPNSVVVMTTQSIHALGVIQNKIVHHPRITACLAPYDSPWCVYRFMRQWNPSSYAVVEAEIWPCMWHTIHRRAIPSIVVDFHMSINSYGFWKKIRPLFLALYAPFAQRWSGCRTSMHYFNAITRNGMTMTFSPTLKYLSSPVPDRMTPCAPHNPSHLWHTRPVWMASCGHKDDEPFMYDAHTHILQHKPDALFIYAPRHMHRVPDIVRQCTEKGWSVVRYSDHDHATPLPDHCTVYIIDVLGQLDPLYQALPFVVMGGSFYPSGRGHNLIEPIANHCAPLYGPFMRNCLDVVNDCATHHVGQCIQPNHIGPSVLMAMHNTTTVRQWADKGLAMIHKQTNTANQTLNTIVDCLTHEP